MQIACAATCVLIMALLTSCAAIQRETRLIQGDWPKDVYFVSRDVQISSLPRVRLWSSCPGETRAFVGPLFILPLPVIPNPFWPFQYWSFNNKPAYFHLTVTAPPKTVNWENVNVEMLLNETAVKVNKFEDHSDVWKDERQYTSVFGITCGELEGSKIHVNISGLPQKVETNLLYTHRWRVYSDGS